MRKNFFLVHQSHFWHETELEALCWCRPRIRTIYICPLYPTEFREVPMISALFLLFFLLSSINDVVNTAIMIFVPTHFLKLASEFLKKKIWLKKWLKRKLTDFEALEMRKGRMGSSSIRKGPFCPGFITCMLQIISYYFPRQFNSSTSDVYMRVWFFHFFLRLLTILSIFFNMDKIILLQ